MKVLKAQIHVIDNEFNGEYTHTGYFLSNGELYDFCRENKQVGNTVTILSREAVEVDARSFYEDQRVIEI